MKTINQTLLITTLTILLITTASAETVEYTPEELEGETFTTEEDENYNVNAVRDYLELEYTQNDNQVEFEEVDIEPGRSIEIGKPGSDQSILLYRKVAFPPEVERSGDSESGPAFNLENTDFEEITNGIMPEHLNTNQQLENQLVIEFENSRWSLNSFQPIPSSDFAEDKIRYQYFKDPAEDLEIDIKRDVKPLTVSALKAEYPMSLSQSSLETRFYADRLDLDKIEVYECTIWNFEESHCKTDWGEPVDQDNIEANLVSDVMELEALDAPGGGGDGISTAYMVGIERGLGSPITLKQGDIEISSERLSVDESIYFEGTLVDERNQEPVTSTNLEITILNQENHQINETVETTTNTDGEFSSPPTDVPEEPGNYDLKLQANQDPYDPLDQLLEDQIEIYEDAEMRLNPPNNPEITPGETTTETWTVQNTGQATLQNITIQETQITSGEGHYTISPEQIDEIERDETASVSITYRLPTDYCPQQNCEDKQETETTIEATTQHQDQILQRETTETIELPQTNQEQQEEEQETETTPLTNLDVSATGNMIQDETDLETLLTLTVALIFAAIIAIKINKKRNKTESKQTGQETQKQQKEEISDEESDETEKLEEALKQQQKEEQKNKKDKEKQETNKARNQHLQDLKSQVQGK